MMQPEVSTPHTLVAFHLRRYRKPNAYLYGCHKYVHTHMNHEWIEIDMDEIDNMDMEKLNP